MRHKFEFGIFSLLISFIFMLVSFKPTLSGGIIGINTNVSFTFILSLAFFFLAIFVFAAKQDLEAIIVLTGGGEWNPLSEMYADDQERSETALKSGNRLKDTGYFVISGYYPHGDMKAMQKSQDYSIYKYFREHKIIPKDILVEGQSHDTLENALYSLKKIKQRAEKEGRTGTLDLGISTYHDHFRRFKDFYEKAVKKGLIGKDDFRLHEISTPETEEHRKYETDILRRVFHRLKLARIGRYRAKDQGIKHAKPDPLTGLISKIRSIFS